MQDLRPVAVVTGASRGARRGIAVALGSHGCKVFVTGRSEKVEDASLPGTIHETAEAVTAAGGQGIAVRVDHGDDEQVRFLFNRVHREAGRLDILVNNACALQWPVENCTQAHHGRRALIGRCIDSPGADLHPAGLWERDARQARCFLSAVAQLGSNTGALVTGRVNVAR